MRPQDKYYEVDTEACRILDMSGADPLMRLLVSGASKPSYDSCRLLSDPVVRKDFGVVEYRVGELDCGWTRWLRAKVIPRISPKLAKHFNIKQS